MPTQDTSGIKEKIIFVFKKRGPSLPVHVAQETGMSILFASAFLSELLAEKKIKISNMKVGSSPLYFISGQEFMLEKFSEFLNSKEKESFILLKEKKILKDSEQNPAIRVALRNLKDFAIPFNKNEEIYWKYFNLPKEDFEKFTKPLKSTEPSIKLGKSKEIPKKIFVEKEKKIIKKTYKSKTLKQSEKFLEKVKEFLSKSSVEILSIENIRKNELVLKVKDHEGEKLLVAYNKKRISEKEIIKAAKKASELNLKYSVFSLGNLPKKISDLIDALQNLIDIDKVK
tara:strand:+ start:206 stop:1060 length:855 start_codon:yes stop_codon:yes gene_type:complete